MRKNKKNRGSGMLIALIVIQSFSHWMFFPATEKVQATGPTEENKLVAVFVQEDIYEAIKADIQRYTIQYIQSRLPRTKAIVFPVDTKTIQAFDIQRILTNLRYGGEKDTPSTLIGTVLIGDIPLPVIKEQDRVQPSIIPYTDIEKPAYIYDPVTTWYIPTSSSVDNKQEIFHGKIVFSTPEKYKDYFTKMKTYISQGKNNIAKKFWYEDFYTLPRVFTQEQILGYAQGQIHDEDISYHRYTTGFFSLLQGYGQESSLDIFGENTNGEAQEQANINNTQSSESSAGSDDYSDMSETNTDAFTAALGDREGSIKNHIAEGKNELADMKATEKIPTVLLEQSIQQQINPYYKVFSAEYGNTIQEEIGTSGRWTGVDISSHIQKTALFDTTQQQFLLHINMMREKALEQKIQTDNYAMRIPIPVTKEEYYCVAGVPTPPQVFPFPPAGSALKKREEVFYFGKNAWDITNASETTWFRGSTGNYTDPTTIKNIPSNDQTKGVGSSLGFTAQQVVASKGYNVMGAKKDAEDYEYRREHCGTNTNANVSYEQYKKLFWGGNTAINLNPDDGQLYTNDREYAYNPTNNRSIGGALFDIAGSTLISPLPANTPAAVARTTAQGAKTYGRFLRIAPGPLSWERGSILYGSQKYPWCLGQTPAPIAPYDFLSLFASGEPADKDIQIINGATAGTNTSYTDTPICKERIVYKTISSIVEHTSPTPAEISGMNITTLTRPIDEKRYISFQGRGGHSITLEYPDIYDVPVYENINGVLHLRSPEQIKEAISAYLQNSIATYNTTLSNENAFIAQHFLTYATGFTRLAAADPLASPNQGTIETPQYRLYQPLPQDFLIQIIGDETLTRIAQGIHLKNSARGIKVPQATVGQTIDSLTQSISLEEKAAEMLIQQLTTDNQTRGTNTTGYEAAYIRSFGTDTVTPAGTVPALIQQAIQKGQKAQRPSANANKHPVEKQQEMQDAACGVHADGTVPLLKRPKAVTCRWKNLKKTTLKDVVKISYKNAQGPVYPLSQFGSVLDESYKDYMTYATQALQVSDNPDLTMITTVDADFPTTTVLYDAHLPFSISAKNKAGDEISSLLFPLRVSASAGALIVAADRAQTLDVTRTDEPIILDTSGLPETTKKITITITSDYYTGVQKTYDIKITQGALLVTGGEGQNSVLGNTGLTVQLPSEEQGYNTYTANIPSLREDILPKLTIAVTDNESNPLPSLATITSDRGLLQPCVLEQKKELTIAGQVISTSCKTQNIRTITGEKTTITFLPTMAQGTDTLHIHVPGLPVRDIPISIQPAAPYRVLVTQDTQTPQTQEDALSIRFHVQDRRGNAIQTPQQIAYTLFGGLTTTGEQTEGALVVQENTHTVRLTQGKKGGQQYVYARLTNIPDTDQLPGYLQYTAPRLLRPQRKINIAYLVLDGKDWGNPETTQLPDMISSSSKLLTVRTNLTNPQEQYPLVGMIDPQGNSIAGSLRMQQDEDKTILFDENTRIGYIDYAPLPTSGSITAANIIIENSAYVQHPSYAGGSTNKRAFAIVKKATQDSQTQPPAYAFSAIRSFAAGTNVGESEKHIYDKNSIIYGDPFLQHPDASSPLPEDTNKQTQTTLFQDDEKTIKKVMDLDIDADGRQDMAILYDDDTIRFLKQYGGSPAYRQLGNLMAIVDGVKEMRIGDADGNKRPDVFIQTKKNTLRVYRNEEGSFDVHGTPICLDVPTGDTSLDGVRQLFVRDMNNDTYADIVTHDINGAIRITYGGKGDSYISQEQYGCDAQWRTRQQGHTHAVGSFGIHLVQNSPIYDESLIHRKGLTLPEEPTQQDNTDEQPTNVPSTIASMFATPNNPTNINLQSLISAGIANTFRYTATPYDELPVYETAAIDKIAYIPARYLTGNDIIQTYKTFAREEQTGTMQATPHTSRVARVTITIKATQTTKATYIESLRGPWDIQTDADNAIVGFKRGTLPDQASITRNRGNGFQFSIDNISLQAGQEIRFSYLVTAIPTQLVTIDIQDTNSDNRQDITTTPQDSCTTAQTLFRSIQGKTYTKITEETQTLSESITAASTGTKSTIMDITNGIQSVQNDPSLSLPGIRDLLEDRDYDDTVINNILNGNMDVQGSFSIDPLALIPGFDSQAVEETISAITQGACKGFGGGGGNLPVPFNMAFLAPGTFNVFGCKVANDKGLPAFFFPGTVYTPAGPIPIPYGQKGPTDSFYRAGGGVYDSRIRIYIAPTLTASVGFAICLGNKKIAEKLPSPLRDMAGNCIVIAAKPKGKSGNTNSQQAGNMQEETTHTTNGGATCRAPIPDPTKPISPFTLQEGNNSLSEGTHLGLIDLNITPTATQYGQESIAKERLTGAKPITLKIEGGNVKGLIKCVINKWLDNQIRYTINNLTNMSINISLPDVAQLAEGFGNIQFDTLSSLAADFKKPEGTANTPGAPNAKSPAGQLLKNLVTTTQGENEKSGVPVGKSDIRAVDGIINNPFDALGSWFEQVPLIRINTQNVTVQVPFLYNEDITKYTAQLEQFGKQIEKDLEEWERLIKDLTGMCEREETQQRKEACNRQIAKYVSIKANIAQLQSSVRSNLTTLQAYKRFPLELQKWLTVSQRYLQEMTNTVAGVSTDITSWVNTNATRFESYVDSIILMVGAVQSRQAIIDFSVDRKSKCGQCTVDNYDYYSCSLGMLCPKLPILAIPPFRLPNIFIDLSHINMGMDILLPKVQFVPKSIDLPALPTLPHPPSLDLTNLDAALGMSIAIPRIPQLPAPPTLPELPSFIPSIDLNLPTLPPAPKVPRIAPAITATLKVTGVIGKIMCIVKNGIGLVGEKGVKTRIEQLTQRTRSVEPFDSLSITKIQPPLRGFDIKVDGYVDFEMNFGGLYTLVDELTQRINKKTMETLRTFNKGVAQVSQGFGQLSQEMQNSVDTAATNAVSDTIQGANTLIDEAKDTLKINYKEPEQVSPDTLRHDLRKEITALKNSERGPLYAKAIQQVETVLNTDTHVTPHHSDIQQATQATQNIIAETQATLDDYKKQIHAYDTFLDRINASALIDEKTTQTTINASLFTTSKQVHDIVATNETPLTSYLNLQEQVTDGFLHAMETRPANELHMGQFTYNKLYAFFRDTKQTISDAKQTLLAYEQPIAGTETLENTSLGQTTNLGTTPETQASSPAQTPSSQSGSQPGRATAQEEKTTYRRDAHHIYTTHNSRIEQKNDGTRFTRYYATKPITSYNDFADRVDENGYVTIHNTAFGVWNKSLPLATYATVGQSAHTVTVSRKNNGQKAYIIELAGTIYAGHEHMGGKDAPKKYVIVYASGTNAENAFLDITGIPNRRVEDLYGTIVYDSIIFDEQEPLIEIKLALDGERRSYSRIAPASITTHGTNHIIRKIASWSHQETLGIQQRGDTIAPTPTIHLIDKNTNAIIAQGPSLQAPTYGTYALAIEWQDSDGIVVTNTLNTGNEEQRMLLFSGNKGGIDGIPSDTATILTYLATATDQAGNKANQTITLTFTKPTIDIKNVTQEGEKRDIISNLSTLFSGGYVKFFKQKEEGAHVLTGIQGSQYINMYQTQPTSTEVIGGHFYDADTITLFTADKEKIATIEKATGKIYITPTREQKLALRLDTTQNTPIILFVDTTNGKTLFSLYLKSKQLLDTSIVNNLFTQETLSQEEGGTFAGGICIKDTQGICAIYIASDGNIFFPDTSKARIAGTYAYNGGVQYTLSIDGQPAARIQFIPVALTP